MWLKKENQILAVFNSIRFKYHDPDKLRSFEIITFFAKIRDLQSYEHSDIKLQFHDAFVRTEVRFEIYSEDSWS